jgi:predicted nucleotidyltransferase
MTRNQASIPKMYQKDIQHATRILKEAGCSQVYVFGSLASGKTRRDSDIDLAVKGCPEGQYFRILGKLLLEVDHPVDLVLLDRHDPFGLFLQEHQELVQID